MTTDSAESGPPADAVEVKSDGPGPGQRLRTAREARRLSLEQVAESLHLDEAIVVALEQERFEALGAPVYVRGHLKAYAALLGLPPNEVLGEYRGATPTPAPALPAARTTAFTVNPTLWGGAALTILLGLLLGIYLLLGDDSVTVDVDARNSDAAKPAPVSVQAVDTESAPPAVESVPEPALQTKAEPAPMRAPPATARVPAAAPAPRPAATMRLGLRFNQESWVEISDANRRLLFGLQREGRARQLTGEPPFNLLIGNAEGVELTVNDEPYDVPAAGLRGKVARFEITGDAVAQAGPR